MLKIIKNPDVDEYNKIKKLIEQADGYCPCVLKEMRNEDTKCLCKNFREQNYEGFCHCGCYKKTEM